MSLEDMQTDMMDVRIRLSTAERQIDELRERLAVVESFHPIPTASQMPRDAVPYPGSPLVESHRVVSEPGASVEVTEYTLTPEGRAALNVGSAESLSSCDDRIRAAVDIVRDGAATEIQDSYDRGYARGREMGHTEGFAEGQASMSPDDSAWKDQDDKPLPEDEKIHAAFPTRSERHDLYAEAMRLVGARYSKGGLVALVNWLLHERKAEPFTSDPKVKP